MVTTRKSEQGFSLVEMAIVMVIIGLIVAAVTVGKSTMKSAETLKAYQKLVVPCVAAVSEGIRNGATPTSPGNLPSIKLNGETLSCTFTANSVTIVNAPTDLQALMAKNLGDSDAQVSGNTISYYMPGGSGS